MAIFERLKYIYHSAPVRIKIMGIVIAFVCLLGASVIVEIRSHMTEILSDQLQKRGTAIASDVAARSTNLMLVGDTFSLHQMAKSVPLHYEDVRYLMIIDKTGQLVANTFGEGVPEGLLQLHNPLDKSEVKKVLAIDSEEGELLDIIAPIGEGKVGWVRIGMSELSMNSSINHLSTKLMITTVGVSLLGLLGALGLSYLVTKPIKSLVGASRAVAHGDLSPRVTTFGEDEISQLGNTFNLMAANLEQYTSEREALVKELTEKEQVRTTLLKKVISAQEDERKRISRELHDETSQSLTSLIIGLKVLSETKEIDTSIKTAMELRDLAATTLKEVHRLAVELRPTVLDDMGLIPAIERYVQTYRNNYSIDIDLHVQNRIAERLSGEIETTLYRIVQEALTNIVKYAEADKVSIVLEIRSDVVNLIVEDDGKGFDVELFFGEGGKDKHLGLAGIQERTFLLGGEFTIESTLGKGTAVYVRLPLGGSSHEANQDTVAVS